MDNGKISTDGALVNNKNIEVNPKSFIPLSTRCNLQNP
ncbi:Branched chain amino acid aminotransferase [Streptococcus pneumoniae]|nr:Branched chain amino acid aminotransferase [Streptococcus pneumoniae]VJD38043.1 Branched chain amino acid aminotransferase [Streptococcus pneumoniae]VJD70322.1 Branched chain amino acid aminotransferase [Streptococcus pneumoniae]VJE31043.1 Branched chain amino acid aminotransferase [Streptococcus pneumoniae]VKL09436.1 Branched chain amino acid aminotransferase [Streptococcus pneumoniae]